MKVFVNNFNDVMGHRSTETRDGPTLDDRICAIFAALQPGARMLTLNRMLALGPSRDQANAVREQRGLEPSADASFFSYRTVMLEPKARPWAPEGEDVVSWSGSPSKRTSTSASAARACPGAPPPSSAPREVAKWATIRRRRSSTTRATSWSRSACTAGRSGARRRGSGAGSAVVARLGRRRRRARACNVT